MKYKTLCRLLVRLIGVYFLAQGLANLWQTAMQMIQYRQQLDQGWSLMAYSLIPAGELFVGSYLFIGGQWIVDKLIPSNRPYCHECGYDLTGAVGNICAECGTAFDPKPVVVEPHH